MDHLAIRSDMGVKFKNAHNCSHSDLCKNDNFYLKYLFLYMDDYIIVMACLNISADTETVFFEQD